MYHLSFWAGVASPDTMFSSLISLPAGFVYFYRSLKVHCVCFQDLYVGWQADI